MKRSNTRSYIVEAALELIAERGFHAAPMAEIAKKAGVAVGTIYRYFETKDILINKLHRELEDKLSATLQEGYPVERPLREKFFNLSRGLLRYFITNPLHFRYIEQYFSSPYGISLHSDRLLIQPGNHNILMDIFGLGLKRQVLKELPEAVSFALAFGPLIFVIRNHILGFIVLDEDLINQTTEACWDAIKR